MSQFTEPNWLKFIQPFIFASMQQTNFSLENGNITTVKSRRLYILCWSEFSRRRLQPAVSQAAGHLTTPTVAGLPGLCE